MDQKALADLGNVLRAQELIIARIEARITAAESSLAGAEERAGTLQELTRAMDEIEAGAGHLTAADIVPGPEDVYHERVALIRTDLEALEIRDWESFVSECRAFLVRSGVLPLEPETLDEPEEAVDDGHHDRWDALDYAFVGAAGVLGALTDFLLVRIPHSVTSGRYQGQLGSPLTAWLKRRDTNVNGDWFSHWARALESRCKVPYDASVVEELRVPGMYPRSHRLQSIGHDPVLGLVMGVLDILRGTITGFSYDHLTGHHRPFQASVSVQGIEVGLIEAFLKQIGHLASDVGTPMGIPAPFFGALQGLNTGSFGPNDRSIGELSRWMYLNGYDLRHFATMGVTPLTVESVLRGYVLLRHYAENGDTPVEIAASPKYRSMLLMAHAIAALGNAGKVALYQGNPLAINQAEWWALVRYLEPYVKHWIIDQSELRLARLKRAAEEDWTELLLNSSELLSRAFAVDSPGVAIGRGIEDGEEWESQKPLIQKVEKPTE